MKYFKFSPNTVLNPYVECYFVWKSGGDDITEQVFESPPSGFCSLVFNLGQPYFLQNKKYYRLAVPQAFIAGQSIFSYKLYFNAPINMAGIVLKPAALATLFNLPAYQYTEERIDLKNVLLPDWIGRVFNELSICSSEQQQAKVLEAFILRQFESSHPVTDNIDEVANHIVEVNGMLHVNDLLQNLFMSRRNFERRFFKKVGLSPKYYARIRRIAYILNQAAGKKKVDWPTLFHQCEFYDQSHFIKDFVEFTGRTPHQYLQDNRELANYVEKPQHRLL